MALRLDILKMKIDIHSEMNLVNVKKIDDVYVLQLNSPHNLNALSQKLITQLYNEINKIKKNARAIVFTGMQKAFASGVDISEISKISCKDAIESDFINEQWEIIADLQIPTIAAVNGYAFGGGFELCLMCDVIFASENAKFGLPEVNLGLMPGIGGTQRLSRLVGVKIATYMCMTGQCIDAQMAMNLGIVSKVVTGDALDEAVELAQKLAKLPKESLKFIKESIKNSEEMSMSAGIAAEKKMFKLLFATEDKEEGISAFLEKRKANFS